MKKSQDSSESEQADLNELLRRVTKDYSRRIDSTEHLGERRRMIRTAMNQIETASPFQRIVENCTGWFGKWLLNPQFAFAMLLFFSFSFLQRGSNQLVPSVVSPQEASSGDDLEALYQLEEESVADLTSDGLLASNPNQVQKEESEEDSAFGFEGEMFDSESGEL